MKRESIKTFTAQFTLGLKAGYTERAISIDELKKVLTEAQKHVFNETSIKLSAKVTACDIVFSGQDEPSAELQFIQYPKFPVEESKLTVMFEKDVGIDPKIRF